MTTAARSGKTGQKGEKMKYDFTHGKTAQYQVGCYGEMIDYPMFFHYYKDAKDCFNRQITSGSKWVAVSLYDMKKDVRKDFWHR